VRVHLFEFGDQPWLPAFYKRSLTRYLATWSRLTKLYQPTAASIRELLEQSGDRKIIVLAAGSGGGILEVLPDLPTDVEVVLTDIFPDREMRPSDPRVHYHPEPVDARRSANVLKGVRVMYTAFHHFQPADARAILGHAVETKQPIAIFEATDRRISTLARIFFTPLVTLVVMPFVRPFSLWRVFWTWVIPAFPLLVTWDALVSCLRTYNEKEYEQLVSSFHDFEWRFRILKGPHDEPITAFIGIPQAVKIPAHACVSRDCS
jgi:hypothetical protein